MMETAARQRFIEEYRLIRRAEARGSEDPAYYQALPYRDITGNNTAMWAMRAKTYRYFERRILGPLEKTRGRALNILDLGAGNCWMSYRLAVRGHNVRAVDIFIDSLDGLLAARHYPTRFATVAAEFDHLPFAQSSVDLAIFNSSIHYSTGYDTTLAEVRKCLRPGGLLAILDSPVYRKRHHGERMAAERHDYFQRQYGFRSDAVRSIEFLDEPTLRDLANSLNLRWTVYRPWYGWRWHTRPIQAWIAGRRPPSRFWILAGRFASP